MLDFIVIIISFNLFLVCATKIRKTFGRANGLAVFYSPYCAFAVQHTEHVIHECFKRQEIRAWGFAVLWVYGEPFKQFVLP